MQHVFIINPTAGKSDASALLVPQIKAAAQALGVQPVIERTTHAGHARELAARYAASGQPARLYACGGDGTLNEVLQAAVGCPQLAVGCVPCGSGNDFVRNFGGAGDFLDLRGQLCAAQAAVDVLETDYGYSVEICAAGLDAQVAYGIPKFRRLPGCGGTMAYTLSILQAVFSRFGHALEITVDGQAFTGTYMMGAACNGRLYGGGYCAAPYARMDDGLLDLVLVSPVPRVKLPGLLKAYKNGEHLSPDGTVCGVLAPYIRFLRAKSVGIRVLDGRPLIVTVDGECAPRMSVHIRVVPLALNILLPPAVLAAGGERGSCLQSAN